MAHAARRSGAKTRASEGAHVAQCLDEGSSRREVQAVLRASGEERVRRAYRARRRHPAQGRPRLREDPIWADVQLRGEPHDAGRDRSGAGGSRAQGPPARAGQAAELHDHVPPAEEDHGGCRWFRLDSLERGWSRQGHRGHGKRWQPWRRGGASTRESEGPAAGDPAAKGRQETRRWSPLRSSRLHAPTHQVKTKSKKRRRFDI
mmetsp:Transcript_9082/g.22450  ORF Transcript_9082/g.22450 Transcript_9082/m.22450 type:complete len:204 (+) Transcript_9082:149-760(+)